MRWLAASAILPGGATLYFAIFWTGFEFWRLHRVLTYTLMLGTLALIGTSLVVFAGPVFASRADFPTWVQVIGWVVVAVVGSFGMVADRQLGMRVRSFAPFFETNGKLRLKTTGAYGVVRHPIYAAGIGYQVGVFLVTGYVAVAVAWAVLLPGALWFTRQEERRLRLLLADPTAYDRYRERVPALLPFWPRSSR